MAATITDRLFTTRIASGRLLYKLYFIAFIAGIFSLCYYRLTHIPSDHPILWLLVSLAEFWFAATWVFQQGFRWAPTFHVTYPDRLPSNLPPVDLFVCTADPDREPPMLVADTLLSLMAYDYDANKLAFYLSDDGGSELTFHAIYQASLFAKHWLPFCRKYKVEPPAPQAYFSAENMDVGGGCQSFRRDYDLVKAKFEEMQNRIKIVGKSKKVPEVTRRGHKGFREWDSEINPRDHQTILVVLLQGNGKDVDVEGKPMPTLVYVSREKRSGHPHHYKAGALNALNRVSSLMSNAPLILNVDCDMHSNNSQALRDAVCFFLDPKEGHRIGYVQFPQSFNGVTKNDLYANGVKRIYEIEFFGTNAHNGPMYAGTGSVHRRESLNGRKFDPNFPIKLEDKSVKGSKNWTELEEKAKELIRCDYEMGKPWGKEMGVMYGCAVEDVFSGLVFHSRGWQSVFCSPERKAYLGLAPVNTNDTLIQHKRWSTGSLEIFLSDYCPWTHGVGRLKLGQIMCYSFYTLWALWCLPMLCYALIPPLAMANGISLFPQVTDPWFKVFASLGIASHIFSLGELMWAKGTIKMWWNETRMWMMKGSSSYLFSVIVIILKSVGISETGFEITSKVINQEALKRYNQEIMEFAVPSPMFIPTTTLSLLNLYCLLQTTPKILEVGLGGLDHLALQLIISGYISIISMPLYEALFLRKDKGRMPTSVTTYSITLAFLVFYLSSFVM
ncbi:PREDICTED: cellulose synthase-like protein E6 isoform X1 [Nelumbo nucifera]|uniref:Cellulose synthase-like protein E6 isoform X1 n=1 Tax=Nelumbo nucifera TaxID=4432 RepID=A0A1U8B0H3_NELNU|nr:PREDICTED: cellulose synthase-like protein E6 isoform X1 [Nelumbo nucifera]